MVLRHAPGGDRQVTARRKPHPSYLSRPIGRNVPVDTELIRDRLMATHAPREARKPREASPDLVPDASLAVISR